MAERSLVAWNATARCCKLRERESRAALSHARSLRLTNQARIDPRMAGRRADGGPPVFAVLRHGLVLDDD